MLLAVSLTPVLTITRVMMLLGRLGAIKVVRVIMIFRVIGVDKVIRIIKIMVIINAKEPFTQQWTSQITSITLIQVTQKNSSNPDNLK
jgi:hypothetical protein